MRSCGTQRHIVSVFAQQPPLRCVHVMYLVCCSGSLALFIKGHHYNRGTVALDHGCLAQELGFTNLEADRVDNALALDCLQACLDDLELGRVDHKWNLQ